ncbi:MAG: c-type cytochrome [Verrucomicrobia bacterium]|nr:c-type cytochrome [Verrucomicrobiota bacterium]
MRFQLDGSLIVSSFRLLLSASILWAVTINLTRPCRAADPFAEGVRTTPPLNPAAELESFHLPPGFEIQLVAAEPDIAKPMNMAFDAKGRLWVTVTREYPFPLPPGQSGRDAIKILEDFDEAGRARKVTTFADGLNIPIGLYPYKNGVVAWSIPNIWHFQDTDGDGKADTREVLYGPLGWERDTHGMNSSFTRGYDGWLYVTHGYNNNSTVRGKDGSEIRMNSGNVYRVRLDGSRVEQFTWGQVNPFGLCFDALGNLFSADCHSEPVYHLLRGAYYPSFGKPHDGLGFGPSMIFHSHGSTAICGITYYADDLWPEVYRDNIFTGNVMTSAVNRDFAEFSGSSPTAAERPDFIRTDDPWFRPVNLQMGPDGALYIADFYNRIIGHYEVPLQHPGRDRERGRIWRVIYRGPEGRVPLRTPALPDSVEGLIGELGSPNLTRRNLAMNQLFDEFGDKAVASLSQAMANSASPPVQKSHVLWLLHRLGQLNTATLLQAAQDNHRNIRTHAMHVLSETADWTMELHDAVLRGLRDTDPFVVRGAADALGMHPSYSNVSPLLAARNSVPAADTHLLHTVQMALRNQLKAEGVPARLAAAGLSERDSRTLAAAALGLPFPEAGTFLLHHVENHDETPAELSVYLKHISRFAPDADRGRLVEFAREHVAGDLDLQLSLLKSIQEGATQRGGSLSREEQDWGATLAESLLNTVDPENLAWNNTPLEGARNPSNPWILQKRRSSDGTENGLFLSSLPPGGEQLTGILRSQAFVIPETLSLFLAGHDGYPEKPAQKRNLIRLVASASGEVLAQSFPPRNDVAQRVHWDLKQHAGTSGAIEIVDADNGDAYAWLAAGRFDPPVVRVPSKNPQEIAQRRTAGAELALALRLKGMEPRLRALLNEPVGDLETSSAAARALAALNPDEAAASLAAVIADAAVPPELRRALCHSLANPASHDYFPVLMEALRVAPYRVQARLAQSLAGSRGGAERLFTLIENVQASPRLLRERQVEDKLSALDIPGAGDRITRLTQGIAPISEETQRMIDSKRAEIARMESSATEGARIFSQACSVCHQVDGQGGLVAPQLDGIGNRGLERLLEDVLDPNRNVDPAFHTTMITRTDGELVAGLFRREEGASLVFANSAGVEISISKSEVAERRTVETSLMPDNFGEALSEDDLANLMAFLLSKKGAPAAAK